MAFFDFSEAAAPVMPRFTSQAVAPEPALAQDRLSPLEWRVLDLSRGDGLETLREPPKRSWFGRLLLGPTPPSRALANERLEALRRLAVEARHKGWLVRASAIAAAEKAGFTDEQISLVIDNLGHEARVRRKLA